MKTVLVMRLLVVLAAISAVVVVTPTTLQLSSAQKTVEVSIKLGSGSPGNPPYYIPETITVEQGTTITWTNTDTVPHTVTSGKSPESDTAFDSEFLAPKKTWSFTFDKEGSFDYFCLFHPYMTGKVVVSATPKTAPTTTSQVWTGISKDGSVKVELQRSPEKPTQGQKMDFDIKFIDSNGKAIEHMNYEMTTKQGNNEILSVKDGHSHTGTDTQTTSQTLASDDPVEVQIKLLGIGLPSTPSAQWIGPKGEMLSVSVVPEFPLTIVSIVAAVLFGAIIFATRRSKKLPSSPIYKI